MYHNVGVEIHFPSSFMYLMYVVSYRIANEIKDCIINEKKKMNISI